MDDHSAKLAPGYYSIYGTTAWVEDNADGVEVSYGDGGRTVRSSAEFQKMLRDGAARAIPPAT